VRADAWTLLTLTRRPWPAGAQNIGSWQEVLDLVIVAAVITNAAMIAFTMQLLNDYSQYTRYWIFIGFQWVIFAIQFLIRAAIPDEPYDVSIQRQRQDFINAKIIDKEGEEDVAELMSQMRDKFPNIKEYNKAEVDQYNLSSFVKNTIDAE